MRIAGDRTWGHCIRTGQDVIERISAVLVRSDRNIDGVALIRRSGQSHRPRQATRRQKLVVNLSVERIGEDDSIDDAGEVRRWDRSVLENLQIQGDSTPQARAVSVLLGNARATKIPETQKAAGAFDQSSAKGICSRFNKCAGRGMGPQPAGKRHVGSSVKVMPSICLFYSIIIARCVKKARNYPNYSMVIAVKI